VRSADTSSYSCTRITLDLIRSCLRVIDGRGGGGGCHSGWQVVGYTLLDLPVCVDDLDLELKLELLQL
jgi:hypothetical protein